MTWVIFGTLYIDIRLLCLLHSLLALHQRQVHNGTRKHHTRFFAKYTGLPAPIGSRSGSYSRLASVSVSERNDTEVNTQRYIYNIYVYSRLNLKKKKKCPKDGHGVIVVYLFDCSICDIRFARIRVSRPWRGQSRRRGSKSIEFTHRKRIYEQTNKIGLIKAANEKQHTRSLNTNKTIANRLTEAVQIV